MRLTKQCQRMSPAAARVPPRLTRSRAPPQRRLQPHLRTQHEPGDRDGGGQVLQVGVRVGEFVAAGAKAPVVLGDITRLQIRCDVDEQLATRMREGLPAKGYLKGESSLAGGKDRSIALKFVRIEPFVIPKTSLTGASIERVDTRVMQVIYQFDRPADRVLFVGQQMDVYIDASQDAPGK